jgi:hypothetical protein
MSRPFDSETAKVASRLGVGARKRKAKDYEEFVDGFLAELGDYPCTRRWLKAVSKDKKMMFELVVGDVKAQLRKHDKSQAALAREAAKEHTFSTDKPTPVNGSAAQVKPPTREELEQQLREEMARRYPPAAAAPGTNGNAAPERAPTAPKPEPPSASRADELIQRSYASGSRC